MDGIPRLWPFLPPRVSFARAYRVQNMWSDFVALSKVEVLGKTANNAVLKKDVVSYNSNEDDNDDTSDVESCGSDDEAEFLDENE